MTTLSHFWGRISGPLVVRKNTPVMPVLPAAVREVDTPEGPVLLLEKALNPAEVLAVLRFANMRFAKFILEGPSEFKVCFALFVEGMACGKLEANEYAPRTEETVPLTSAALDEIARAAEDAGVAHRMPEYMRWRTDGDDVCFAQAQEVAQAARALGLEADVFVSQSTVSRYVRVRHPASHKEGIEVRISDHGVHPSDQFAVRLRESTGPVIAELTEWARGVGA